MPGAYVNYIVIINYIYKVFHNKMKQFSQQLQITLLYPKFLFFKLLNVSNKDVLSICKRLLCSAINKRNKELQHILKELSISDNFLSKQLFTIDFYILKKSITSHRNKSLQKLFYTQQKKLSLLTRGCSLPIFTANETITNLTQYELSKEESNLFKTRLYFSIQTDKIRKSEIFKRFIVLLLTTLNSRKTKNRIKAHLSYLANSYFYKRKPSPRTLPNIVSHVTLGKIKISLEGNLIKEMELSS